MSHSIRLRLLAGSALLLFLAAVGLGAAALLRPSRPASGQVLVLLSVAAPPAHAAPLSTEARAVGLALLPEAKGQGWMPIRVPAAELRLPGHWQAPAADNLYLSSVPRGRYRAARLVLERPGRGRLVDQRQVDLSVSGKGVNPLLFTLSLSPGPSGAQLRPSAAYGGNVEVNYGLQLAAGTVMSLPDLTLEDQQGRPVRLSQYRGRILVLASFLTECQETCPLVAAALLQLHRLLAQHQLLSQVQIVEVTQDPADDSPAILTKYQRYFDLPWPLLTGSSATLDQFWSELKVPPIQLDSWDGQAPPVDMFTGQPEPYNILHASVVDIVNADGLVTDEVQDQPTLSASTIPRTIYKYLDAQGREEQRQGGAWTPQSLLRSIDPLLQQQGIYTTLPSSSSGVATVGQPAPQFQLPSTVGGEVSLTQELGHPVLIDFWASWCDNCRADLHLVASAAGASGLRVLLVDYQQSRATAAGYLRQAGIPLPSLLDRQGQVATRYGVPGLPVAVFVDAEGKVAAIQIGQLQSSSLQRDLSAAGA